MPERDGYPAGVPCWVDTSQPHPQKAVDYYGALFDWDFENVMPPESDGAYFIARIRGKDAAAVGGQPEGGPPMATWNTYVCVDDADETRSKVVDAGGRVLMEPMDVMDAGRMAVFADPEGAVFSTWQPGRTKGLQIVNEHGALNFNGLNTRDVEGAKAFYGAVFGWETLSLPFGAEMWTLPGYGDHLEERSPGNRQRILEFGATPGFEDVVASINPISEDQPDTPAHWSVTFGADDVDVLAQKAQQLGGRVLVPPFDVPWARVTVIADPQGATFTASKFVPENKDLGNQSAGVSEPAAG